MFANNPTMYKIIFEQNDMNEMKDSALGKGELNI